MKILSAKTINIAMKNIERELDITTTTQKHMVQEAFSDIIIPYGEKGAGTVLTYGKAKARREMFAKKYGQNVSNYTLSQYRKSIAGLSRILENKLTVEQAKSHYIEGAIELIEQYNIEYGAGILLDYIDFDTLKDILNKATKAMGKREKGDSPKLFRYMHQYFEEAGLRNIGEIKEETEEEDEEDAE